MHATCTSTTYSFSTLLLYYFTTHVLLLQVAEAPSLKSSRVQTLRELDLEIDRALPPASEIGVDLSALMRFLTPQEQARAAG